MLERGAASITEVCEADRARSELTPFYVIAGSNQSVFLKADIEIPKMSFKSFSDFLKTIDQVFPSLSG